MGDVNSIVIENQKQGTPQSIWDLNGPASTTIRGFTDDISGNVGTSVQFKIDTDATDYHIDIYRMGYYNGDGARLIDSLNHHNPNGEIQPTPLGPDPETRLVEACNWSVTDSWNIPSDAVSGVYFAKLTRTDGISGENIIPFIVRNDASTSDVIFQTSDTTWQAYNPAGGESLYGNSFLETGLVGRSFASSYDHPLSTREQTSLASGPWDYVFGEEYPTIRFLEQNGYDISYQSGVDTDRYGALLTNHKIFMDAGHDEYWSAQQRANVEAARDAGVNLAFLSGNEVFWAIRWEPNANGTPYRSMVSYKTTLDGTQDPSGIWTGLWRDPNRPGGALPENALTGTMYVGDWNVAQPTFPVDITYDQSRLRFWRNTSVANLQSGDVYQLGGNYIGYEWDVDPDNGFRPAGLIHLSSTSVSTNVLLQDNNQSLSYGTAEHNFTLYRAASGALVFGAGSVFFPWALDAVHDPGPANTPITPADINVQQAMINLFADMGVQPGSLRSGLVGAIRSDDIIAPTATLTASSYVAGYNRISGTATDSGGGVVAGVEVSTDGGNHWRLANGGSQWSYSWYATAGAYTIQWRAMDDSLNLSATNVAQVSVQAPPKFTDYSWAQGWSTSNHQRSLTDINGDGRADYLGFGDAYTFISFYGTWLDAQGLQATTFSTLKALIPDFCTGQGYTDQVQRGAAQTGYGIAESIYGQGYIGVWWYGADSSVETTDLTGQTQKIPTYETTPHLYGNFGSQQGWTSEHGFEVVRVGATDQYASILGFGDAGVVVGREAFSPTATATDSYVIPIDIGNDGGWRRSLDVRTFTDTDGNAIDLNHDGIVDFVGMGPNGLVYALGSTAGGRYTLGNIETAHVKGDGTDFGRPQGWLESVAQRQVYHDPVTGFYDIIAFNDVGLLVSMGQDPSTHNGEPFGQMYLAIGKMGASQGWSHSTTPRLMGDINNDGIPDIVGFGVNSMQTAMGSRDGTGRLFFSIDQQRTLGDFGYTEGWDNTTFRGLANLDGKAGDEIVVSGDSNTQVIHLNPYDLAI